MTSGLPYPGRRGPVAVGLGLLMLFVPVSSVIASTLNTGVGDEVWMETEKLTPADPDARGTPGGDQLRFFGSAVDLDGSLLVVSSQPDTGEGDGTDWVYVFERNGGSWEQVAKLEPEGAYIGDSFGKAVAVDAAAGIIVVGNPGYDRPDPGTAERVDGRAHVFERQATGEWVEPATLEGIADRPDYWGAAFGTSVAVENDTAVVAAPYEDGGAGEKSAGAVYVFDRGPDGWTESAYLTQPERGQYMYFGGLRNGIALEGDHLLVGAPGVRPSGGAYLLEEGDGGWSFVDTLSPPELEGSSSFGFSVAMDHRTLLVGDVGWDSEIDRTIGTVNSGTAYVYSLDGQATNLESELRPQTAAPGDWFGKFIDVSDDTIVVGATEEPPDYTGTAYIFEKEDGGWKETQRLYGHDTSPGDLFGWGVTVDDRTVVVGAPFDDNHNDAPFPADDTRWVPTVEDGRVHFNNGHDAGSVYVFEPVEHPEEEGDLVGWND